MEEETIDDEIISEGAEYSPKSEFSKPKLVYEAMQKCIQSRAKEMKAGYENIKLTKDGMPIKTWVEDSRLIFIGSVIALQTILSPEIKNTEGYPSKIKGFEDKIKEAKETYSYTEWVKENKNGTMIWTKTSKKYIPEVGSSVVLLDLARPRSGDLIKGGWDNKTNIYWDIVLLQYDLILACLNDLINKLNYFKSKTNY